MRSAWTTRRFVGLTVYRRQTRARTFMGSGRVKDLAESKSSSKNTWKFNTLVVFCESQSRSVRHSTQKARFSSSRRQGRCSPRRMAATKAQMTRSLAHCGQVARLWSRLATHCSSNRLRTWLKSREPPKTNCDQSRSVESLDAHHSGMAKVSRNAFRRSIL